MERLFSFKLNGRQVSVSAPPACTLLEVLREKLDVTGPRENCGKRGAWRLYSLDGRRACELQIYVRNPYPIAFVSLDGY